MPTESSQSTGPTSDAMTTRGPSRPATQQSGGSILSAEATPARKIAELGNRDGHVPVRRLAVSLSGLLMRFGLALFSGRIRTHRVGTLPGLGSECDLSWNALVTLCCPSDSDPVALGLTTGGIECSCSPQWRTPLASDNRSRGNKHSKSTQRRLREGKTITLSMQLDGPPSPAFLEELMSFPLGWSDARPSATPLTLPSPSGSADESLRPIG